jgi:hypothetical protein
MLLSYAMQIINDTSITEKNTCVNDAKAAKGASLQACPDRKKSVKLRR